MDATKLGKFEVRRRLGRGAMGLVYEGWDPFIARRVAIKTVRLPDTSDNEAMEMLARFQREAQAAGRLSHPNIVGVFDYGETDEVAFIVMEFIDGKSLKAMLDAHETMPLPEIARVMVSLLAGLQYSHDNGVVHRDIKPANIMLTAQGQVKIADFGIARIESSSMTQTGTVLGTPAYMSPEQFMGQQVDRRTDIYSSGVVLYQMLTGERPFEGGMSSVMHKALNTTPPRPSDLSVIAPPAFDAVVAKAMAKRPENRFESAAAFARALQTAMDGTASAGDDDATRVTSRRPPAPAVAASPVPAVAKAVEKSEKTRTPLVAALATVGFFVVAGTAWYWSPWRASEQPAVPSSQAPAHEVAALPAPVPPPAAVPETTNATATPVPPPVSPPAAVPPVAAPQPAETAAAASQPDAPSPVPVAPLPPAPAPLIAAPQPTETATAAPQLDAASPAPAAPSPPSQETVASASPPVPATPAPEASPAFDLAGARTLARSVPCSLLDVAPAASPGGPTLSGFVQSGAGFDSFLTRLRERYGAIGDELFLVPPVFCETLAAVRDTVWDSREHGRALELVVPDAPVPANGRFSLGVRSAGDAAIYVDLFDEEGGVNHVVRRTLSPGNAGNVQETTSVDKPGRYVVIAIATPVPLNLVQRPVHETAAHYLPALEHELAHVSAAGAGTVRADIAPVAVVAAVRPVVPPSRNLLPRQHFRVHPA